MGKVGKDSLGEAETLRWHPMAPAVGKQSQQTNDHLGNAFNRGDRLRTASARLNQRHALLGRCCTNSQGRQNPHPHPLLCYVPFPPAEQTTCIDHRYPQHYVELY